MITRWRQLSLRHPYWMALILGAAMPLAYAPFGLLPIFYLSFATVFYLAFVHRQSPKQLFIIGWLFGFGQFFTGLYWLGEAFLVDAEVFLWLLPFAVTLLPAGLGLFPALALGVFGISLKALRQQPTRLVALIYLAVLLALAEYCRANILTGLPWNLPSMAWGSWLYLAQPTNMLGVHGLGLMALLSAVFLVSRARGMPLVSAALFLSAFIYSAVVLAGSEAQRADRSGLSILLVQPNLDQQEKWQDDKRRANIDKTFQVTLAGLKAAPKTQLIIWPETAIPALIDETPWFGDALRAELPHADVHLMTGAVRRQTINGKTVYFNAAMLWRGDGQLLQRSDKHQLVPFGEYLPMQGLLEAIGLQQLTKLRGGYEAGPPAARFGNQVIPTVAPLICYEAIFPLLTDAAERPAWLANMTNDGWFGKSIGPRQHLAHVRLRAIEQGLPLVRSANTGISAAFDGHGRLLGALPLGQSGTLSVNLPKPLSLGLYAKFGDTVFFALCLLLMGLIGLAMRGARSG